MRVFVNICSEENALFDGPNEAECAAICGVVGIAIFRLISTTGSNWSISSLAKA